MQGFPPSQEPWRQRPHESYMLLSATKDSHAVLPRRQWGAQPQNRWVQREGDKAQWASTQRWWIWFYSGLCPFHGSCWGIHKSPKEAKATAVVEERTPLSECLYAPTHIWSGSSANKPERQSPGILSQPQQDHLTFSAHTHLSLFHLGQGLRLPMSPQHPHKHSLYTGQ